MLSELISLQILLESLLVCWSPSLHWLHWSLFSGFTKQSVKGESYRYLLIYFISVYDLRLPIKRMKTLISGKPNTIRISTFVWMHRYWLLFIHGYCFYSKSFGHFSSPELKSQASFSYHFFVRRPPVCQFLTISTSPPKPVGQFQLNVAQQIIW